MCRLFGWYNPELPANTDRTRLLIHLARKSQEGGEASFGMAVIKEGAGKLIRHIGPASTWLVGHKKEIADYAKADVIVGHTRQPTKGAVTKANCHPFTIGEWAAAHNGSISNSSTLMEAALYAPRGETDSEEALAFVISYDWDPEVIDKITGSFAFAGAKSDGSEAILVCDRIQSLHYVKFGNGLIWATHGIVLRSSLMAVGIDAVPLKMKSQMIRIPSWSNVAVDKSTVTYYGGYEGYGAHDTDPRAPEPTAETTPATTPTSTTTPPEQTATASPNENSVCKGCSHALSEHMDDSDDIQQIGCFHEGPDRKICSCARFLPPLKAVVEITCPNPACKHPMEAHKKSWGCMRGECKCEEGKIIGYAHGQGHLIRAELRALSEGMDKYSGTCLACSHPRYKHTKQVGCTLCQCSIRGVGYEAPKTVFPRAQSNETCTSCTHVKGVHKRSTGCGMCQCRLEWLLPKINAANSTTPPIPPAPPSQAVQLSLPHKAAGSEDKPALPVTPTPESTPAEEGSAEAQDMVTERELADLRSSGMGIIDMD